ncbi:hypothetical protein [Arcanobacterium hippocoleae]|uniref:Homoserine kinase n=1 Tax=Arcanobacterium hippocoleae TaxID=149017 RepID=A0ABU1T3J8_9ACTO|nr:hypothetical protein [Arcanobacterium hippocoleae]MDR6939970.1 homoserine kinase [Arcanobacterium hippocoleae]
MRIVNEQVNVRVPAGISLFRAGFSNLALSLNLWDEISASFTTRASRAIVLGQGSRQIAQDERHPVIQTMHRLLSDLGQPAFGIELVCRNNIRRNIGLGENEAQIAAALLLVKGMLGNPAELSLPILRCFAERYRGDCAILTAILAGGAALTWPSRKSPGSAQLAKNVLLAPAGAINLQTQQQSGSSYAALQIHSDLRLTLITSSFDDSMDSRAVSAKEVDFQLPASHTAAFVYALQYDPLLLCEITGSISWHSALEANPEIAASAITDLARSLQKAHWPVIYTETGTALLLFAKMPQAMQAKLIDAGFAVQEVAAAQAAVNYFS